MVFLLLMQATREDSRSSSGGWWKPKKDQGEGDTPEGGTPNPQ